MIAGNSLEASGPAPRRPDAALGRTVAAELAAPADPAAGELAEAARQSVADVRAVLLYGGCRRDGLAPDALADLYLLVGRYRASGQGRLAALANRALPPNVIPVEAETCRGRIRAKAAIVELEQFARLVGGETFHSYFWARFAQPATLVWSADDAARQAVEQAVTSAIRTFAAECADAPLAADGSAAFWTEGFRRTYSAELRAEGPERAAALYAADRARYDVVYACLAEDGVAPRSTPGRWRRRRRLGQALSIARLAKAAFTFRGGLDYILWKIERHSGVRLVARPWQRRWPLLAAPGLAWRAWRLGGFR